MMFYGGRGTVGGKITPWTSYNGNQDGWMNKMQMYMNIYLLQTVKCTLTNGTKFLTFTCSFNDDLLWPHTTAVFLGAKIEWVMALIWNLITFQLLLPVKNMKAIAVKQ